MAYLDWKDELNTGIRVIDGQHRRIVDYINQLHDIVHGCLLYTSPSPRD